MKQFQLLVIPLLAWTLAPAFVLAQEAKPDGVSEDQPIEAGEPEELEAPPVDSLEARLLETESRLAALEGGDEGWLDDFDDEESAMSNFLYIYGFFDLSLYKNFYPKHDAMNLLVNGNSSFYISNVGLYFGSHIGDDLDALVELKLSFLPQGLPRSSNTYLTDESGTPDYSTRVASFERENTWQRDPFSSQDFWRHSIAIERAQLTYSPRDWFNVTAGRFLTPYGIWNVDHGPTVVLTAHMPYMQIREMIPLSQMGLQIFGRFFPSESIVLDYAITLSNGRGANTPTSWGDLDENKALGLRLKLTYETMRGSIEVGGYGYYGMNSDRTQELWINPYEKSTATNVVPNDVYEDMAASADLKIRFLGLMLQGEFIFRRANFSIPDPLELLDQIMLVGELGSTHYGATSFTGKGAYGLLAYEIELMDNKTLIPYFLYEYNEAIDTKPYMSLSFLIGGLNFRPNAHVAIKAEYSFVITKEPTQANMHALAAQMAVSF